MESPTWVFWGLLLGLSGGLSPGPLLVLVLIQALNRGFRAALPVAMAPLLTDTPLVAMVILTSARLPPWGLGIMALVGAIWLVYLGFLSWRCQGIDLTGVTTPFSHPFRHAVLVNLLNPHPYLFWLGVGMPLVSQLQTQPGTQALFIGAFYLGLVGAKVGLAVVVSRVRHLLTGTLYRWVVRGLGLGLWGLAVLLAMDGLEYLAIPMKIKF